MLRPKYCHREGGLVTITKLIRIVWGYDQIPHKNLLSQGFQIVFFEMNFMFSTGSERIAVIEDLRKPKCTFPRIRTPTEHDKSRVR